MKIKMTVHERSEDVRGGAVHSSPCSYATLDNYNSTSSMGIRTQQGTSTGSYVVPSYSMPGYNALTHGGQSPSCTGYFGVTSAYGSDASGNCTRTYTRKTCG